jgi:hypothetical protein
MRGDEVRALSSSARCASVKNSSQMCYKNRDIFTRYGHRPWRDGLPDLFAAREAGIDPTRPPSPTTAAAAFWGEPAALCCRVQGTPHSEREVAAYHLVGFEVISALNLSRIVRPNELKFSATMTKAPGPPITLLR